MRRCDFPLNGTGDPEPFKGTFTPPRGFFNTIGSERVKRKERSIELEKGYLKILADIKCFSMVNHGHLRAI